MANRGMAAPTRGFAHEAVSLLRLVVFALLGWLALVVVGSWLADVDSVWAGALALALVGAGLAVAALVYVARQWRG